MPGSCVPPKINDKRMLPLRPHGQILCANYPTQTRVGKRHAASGVRSARRVFDACNVECNTSRAFTETMQARYGAAARQSRMETARRRATSATGIGANKNSSGTDSGGALRELWRLQIGWEGVSHAAQVPTKSSGSLTPFWMASFAMKGCQRHGTPCLRHL